MRLQLNYGKPLDPIHRDALRAKIIHSALNQDIRKKKAKTPSCLIFFDYFQAVARIILYGNNASRT